MRRTLVAGVMAVAWVVGGCSVFDPDLIEPTDDDGTVDMGPVEIDLGPSVEGLRRVPPRPTTPDAEDVDPVTFVLRDVQLSQDAGGAWRDIGLDLDGYDTQVPALESECLPPDDTADPPSDGEEGIDNVFGAELFPVVALALPDLQERARDNHLAGLGTIMLTVTGWNGTGDDPRMTIELTQAAAGTSASPDSVEFSDFDLVNIADGLAAPAPSWDGNDTYWARDDNYFGGEPLVVDNNAYVKDGTVVMRLPDRIEIQFFAGDDAGITVKLIDAFAFATLDSDFENIVQATVAGRWRVLDLLASGDNIGVCQGSAERGIVENQLDKIADVLSTPVGGVEGATCDAVSLGVTFTGRRASYAGVGPSRPLPNPCAGM